MSDPGKLSLDKALKAQHLLKNGRLKIIATLVTYFAAELYCGNLQTLREKVEKKYRCHERRSEHLRELCISRGFGYLLALPVDTLEYAETARDKEEEARDYVTDALIAYGFERHRVLRLIPKRQTQVDLDAHFLKILFQVTEGYFERIQPRILEPQPRWNFDGEPRSQRVHELSISDLLHGLLLDSDRYMLALKHARGLTVELDSDEEQSIIKQGVLLVCHMFPRDLYFSKNFGTAGRDMLPAMEWVIKVYDRLSDLSPSQCNEIADALIAASFFGQIEWKSTCLDRAATLIQNSNQLTVQLSFYGRLCTLSRLWPHHRKLVHKPGETISFVDSYSEGLRISIAVSSAEELIHQDLLDEAQTNLCKINCRNPSTFTRIMLQKRNMTLAKVYCLKGAFSVAMDTLNKSPLNDGDLFYATGREYSFRLAHIACELNDFNKALVALEEHKDTEAIAEGTKSSRFIRLHVCLGEVFLAKGDLTKATSAFNEALSLAETRKPTTEQSITLRFTILRIHIGLARVHHIQGLWEAAIGRWQLSLQQIKTFGWTSSFSEKIVLESIAHIHYRNKDIPQFNEYLTAAQCCVSSKGMHAIVGLGTKWRTFLDKEFKEIHRLEASAHQSS